MDTLIDTGFLVALFNARDPHHDSARQMLAELKHARLLSVWEVLTEATHLLDHRGSVALLRWAAAGRLTIVNSDPGNLNDMADFMGRYSDGGADLADVALVFAGDRLGVHNILTVDRRDFDRYRSPRRKTFRRLWVRD
ncbi:MAG: hypothetical protein Q4B17_06080 [Lautropia sp.]|nr:hypothetical protein [Lautropia sp.]